MAERKRRTNRLRGIFPRQSRFASFVTCPFRKLHPAVSLMESDQHVRGNDVSATLDGSAVGQVLSQAEMGACDIFVK
jgi:hypothetical protein